jgi:zinc protease
MKTSSVLGRGFQLAQYNVSRIDLGSLIMTLKYSCSLTSEETCEVYNQYVKGGNFIATILYATRSGGVMKRSSKGSSGRRAELLQVLERKL